MRRIIPSVANIVEFRERFSGTRAFVACLLLLGSGYLTFKVLSRVRQSPPSILCPTGPDCPKGLNNKAQGWRESAYPGSRSPIDPSIPTGLPFVVFHPAWAAATRNSRKSGDTPCR